MAKKWRAHWKKQGWKMRIVKDFGGVIELWLADLAVLVVSSGGVVFVTKANDFVLIYDEFSQL
jgi:hypothetical protein